MSQYSRQEMTLFIACSSKSRTGRGDSYPRNKGSLYPLGIIFFPTEMMEIVVGSKSTCFDCGGLCSLSKDVTPMYIYIYIKNFPLHRTLLGLLIVDNN